jgi:hypothetical protein
MFLKHESSTNYDDLCRDESLKEIDTENYGNKEQLVISISSIPRSLKVGMSHKAREKRSSQPSPVKSPKKIDKT